MFNKNSSCRFCLKDTARKTFYSIFEKPNGLDVVKIIRESFKIEITDKDYLDKICDDCLKDVRSINEIYTRFYENNFKLKDFLASIKDEDLDFEEIKDVFEANSCDDKSFNEHQRLEIEQDEFDDVNSSENSSLSENNSISTKKLQDVKEKGCRCYICDKNWDTRTDLRGHFEEKHKDITKICLICGRSRFQTMTGFNIHLGLHDERKRYKCALCYRRFTEKNNLKLHFKRIHGKKTVAPKEVNIRKFPRQFQCSTCGNIYTQFKTLKLHELRHTDATPQCPCHVCGKVFLHSKALRDHVRQVHSNKFKYICSHCQKKFLNHAEYKNHLSIHTGEKKFECTVCNIKFRLTNNLRAHNARHHSQTANTLLTNYCKYCKTNFSKRTEIVAHFETEHVDLNIKLPTCHHCGEKYVNNSRLNAHIREYHDKDYKFTCSVCGKGFFSVATFNAHENSHKGIKNFQCEICHKNFMTKRSLERHTIGHNTVKNKVQKEPKVIICQVCNKEFSSQRSLNRHSRLHTNVQYFSCSFCNKNYTRSDSLQSHLKSKHSDDNLF